MQHAICTWIYSFVTTNTQEYTKGKKASSWHNPHGMTPENNSLVLQERCRQGTRTTPLTKRGPVNTISPEATFYYKVSYSEYVSFPWICIQAYLFVFSHILLMSSAVKNSRKKSRNRQNRFLLLCCAMPRSGFL